MDTLYSIDCSGSGLIVIFGNNMVVGNFVISAASWGYHDEDIRICPALASAHAHIYQAALSKTNITSYDLAVSSIYRTLGPAPATAHQQINFLKIFMAACVSR